MIDDDLETQLQKALKECALLREENERLRKLLGLHPENRTPTFKPNGEWDVGSETTYDTGLLGVIRQIASEPTSRIANSYP
jgi:regulator of replication initiation timing